MDSINKLNFIQDLKATFALYSNNDIENGVMCYYLDAFNKPYDVYYTHRAHEILNILKIKNTPTDLETVVDIFESLIKPDKKTENGIVFTPKYISDYIVDSILMLRPWDGKSRFIDPGCGSGIFLISVVEKLHEKYNIPIDTIIEKYIFGIDVELDNVRCCILALKLLSAKHNGNYESIEYNIQCFDSLKNKWSEKFSVESFSYVIGNPPYVNLHDIDPKTTKFLKNTFMTTKSGVFNIFYAFVECAMNNISPDGMLGYIVPNNFLTIKSAIELRKYLQSNLYLDHILDFGSNMVFKPVRTYNCIIILNKKQPKTFQYYVMSQTPDIELSLKKIAFSEMKTHELDYNGWNLVDEVTRNNILKIESNPVTIKPFIRTGIATLKDSAFMVDRDDCGYYKKIDDKKMYVEDGLIKPIYKIPELKMCDNIESVERYIIFPYVKSSGGYALISEEELIKKYPLTYRVLLACKDSLDSRDKGRPNPQGWFAYGRTQGLNKYGKKLLFPTFSVHPRFICVENEDSLFCNGYGVFENDILDLKILEKILNSKVMDYYVSNTSYCIEGGYYCYQKKYIEKFSIPHLSETDEQIISGLFGSQLDGFLWRLYGLE